MAIPCTYLVSVGGENFRLWTTNDRFYSVCDNYENETDVDLNERIGVDGVLYFSRRDWRSLVLTCDDKESARKCVDRLGLGLDSDSFLNEYNVDIL